MPEFDQHLALYITFSQPQRQQAQPLSVTQHYEHHNIQSPTHLILLSIQNTMEIYMHILLILCEVNQTGNTS